MNLKKYYNLYGISYILAFIFYFFVSLVIRHFTTPFNLSSALLPQLKILLSVCFPYFFLFILLKLRFPNKIISINIRRIGFEKLALLIPVFIFGLIKLSSGIWDLIKLITRRGFPKWDINIFYHNEFRFILVSLLIGFFALLICYYSFSKDRDNPKEDHHFPQLFAIIMIVFFFLDIYLTRFIGSVIYQGFSIPILKISFSNYYDHAAFFMISIFIYLVLKNIRSDLSVNFKPVIFVLIYIGIYGLYKNGFLLTNILPAYFQGAAPSYILRILVYKVVLSGFVFMAGLIMYKIGKKQTAAPSNMSEQNH